MQTKNPSATARIVVSDLIAFIALAASVAVATAIVLAATVLLLAGRAEAAVTPHGALPMKSFAGKEAPRRWRLA